MPVMARETIQFKEEGIDGLFAKIDKMKKELHALNSVNTVNPVSKSGLVSWLNSAQRDLDAWNQRNRKGLLWEMMSGAGIRGLGAIGAGYMIGKATHSAEREFANIEEQMLAVQKTTGLTDEQITKLKFDLLNLGAEMRGISDKDLLKIAEVAGQLGIQGSKDILAFAASVARMESVSDFSAEEAANSFAQVLNIYHKSADEAERLGSVWNVLADTSTATESQIADLTRRIAGAGQVAGLTIPEIAALAATLKDTGTDVEVGGTAMTQLITGMIKGTDAFAEAIGVSAEEFAKIWEDQPIQAIQMFLNKLSSAGKDAITILDELGFDGTRVVSTMLKMAQGTEALNTKIAAGNKAWEEATSLQKAYESAGRGVNAQLDRMSNSAHRAEESLWSLIVPLEKLGINFATTSLDVITETIEQWKKILERDDTNTEGDRYLRKQIDDAEELSEVYQSLIGLQEKIDNPKTSAKDRIAAMQEYVSKANSLKNPGFEDSDYGVYADRMQKRLDHYSKTHSQSEDAVQGWIDNARGAGNSVMDGFKGAMSSATYWKETLRFGFINALTPIAKQVDGDPKKWLEERKKEMEKAAQARDNAIESTAQKLDDYKKRQETSPMIEGLNERFNRLQLAAIDPEKWQKKDEDILKDILTENKASKQSLLQVRDAIDKGFAVFKDNKLVFVGSP